MIKNQVQAFIGFLRLYRSNNYSIILTLDHYKVKYAILDSNDNEVTDIQGVDWYDLVDVLKTMQLLECEAAYVDTDMFEQSNSRYIDLLKYQLNKLHGRSKQND